MHGGKRIVDPPKTGPRVIVRIDQHFPAVLKLIIRYACPVECQGLRNVSELKHDGQELLGKGAVDLDNVDMRGRHVAGGVQHGLTGRDDGPVRHALAGG